MAKHQRKNAISNTAVGAEFEALALAELRRTYPSLIAPFWLPIGYLSQKKHKFDLGCAEQRVIVECKSHTWTEGGNVPSAKITTWDQAMLYFFLAPRGYTKLFVVKRDLNPKSGESLADYYVRTHYHVIPDEVQFIEVDEELGTFLPVSFDATAHITGLREGTNKI